jgi:steroid delta-isomerase-like uncharacterized protein
MMVGGNERWFEDYLEAWNTREGHIVAAWMSEDVTYADAALCITLTGRPAVAGFVERARSFAPDYVFDPVSIICSDTRYAGEWVWTGTHLASTPGIAARSFSVRGVSLGSRSPEGTIMRNTDYWNASDLREQLRGQDRP